MIKPADMTPENTAARRLFRAALEQRFINPVPVHVHRIYSIATLTDPRFKNFRFITDQENDTAHQQLRQEWEDNWKPREAEDHREAKPTAVRQERQRPGLTALLANDFRISVATSDDDNTNSRVPTSWTRI